MSPNLPLKDDEVGVRILNQIQEDVTCATFEQVRIHVDFNLKSSLVLDLVLAISFNGKLS